MPTTETNRAIEALGYKGTPITCTKEAYETEVRTALQNQAAKWIDQGQAIRAQMALNEVKRLDAKFGVSF
jgi:hypothetical protein